MKNKVLAVLLSAAVAFGLWLYVITVVNPESEKTYYDIPVVIQNKEILAERGLMIVSNVPKVTLVLKSSRTILNNLNEANINVIANVANIEKPGTHNLSYNISYPGNVPYNEVAVQSSSTDLVTIKIENKIKKMIPVVIDYGGTAVPDGFIADLKNVQLDYQAIVTSGPESVMKKIEKAVIKVNLTDRTKTMIEELEYTLCDAEGKPVDAELVTTNVDRVNLTLKIQRMKEIALVVEVLEGGGATAETSTILITPQTIWVSGSDVLLENLEQLNIGTVNLAEMLQNKILEFPIIMPEGVTNETGLETATVDVRFPMLMMKAFSVTSITAINVPEGMEVAMITQALEVIVRGPISVMKTMTASDIMVTVDFAGVQLGTATVKAEVSLGAAFAEVGTVGTYQVTATLQEALPVEVEK